MKIETERYVFDTYEERAATVYTEDELPAGVVVVSDSALVNREGSMPSQGDPITIAGESRVVRGKVNRIAYIVEPDA